MHNSRKCITFASAIRQGEVLEWLKRHAWKACNRQKRFAGSNPVLSAKQENGFKAFEKKAQSCSLRKAKQQSPLNLSGLYLFNLTLSQIL